MSAGLLRSLWQPYLVKMAAEPDEAVLDPAVTIPAMLGGSAGALLGAHYGPRVTRGMAGSAMLKLYNHQMRLARRLMQKDMNWSNAQLALQPMDRIWEMLEKRPHLYAEYLRRQNPFYYKIPAHMLRFIHNRPWITTWLSGLGGALAAGGLGHLIHSLIE